METLVVLLPAAGCAALMIVCFRICGTRRHGRSPRRAEMLSLERTPHPLGLRPSGRARYRSAANSFDPSAEPTVSLR